MCESLSMIAWVEALGTGVSGLDNLTSNKVICAFTPLSNPTKDQLLLLHTHALGYFDEHRSRRCSNLSSFFSHYPGGGLVATDMSLLDRDFPLRPTIS